MKSSPRYKLDRRSFLQKISVFAVAVPVIELGAVGLGLQSDAVAFPLSRRRAGPECAVENHDCLGGRTR